MSASGYNGATERDPGFLRRMWAMVVKEFVQMRRDRLTFATMIFVPILQLTLFGYAINTDPKQLPTAVLVRDDGPLTRAVLAAMKNTDYFDFRWQVRDPEELDKLIRSGDAQFGIEIPASFERDVRRGRPACRAGDRRRHRPGGDGHGDLGGGGADRYRAQARAARARRERQGDLAAVRAQATAPLQSGRLSPNTISCPACSAWC